MTSFQAVREVRRTLGERRAGHAGTLDPAASGLLPVCIGPATRLIDYLHTQPKRYHCVVRLGERSDTFDTEGTISPGGSAAAVDEERVRRELERFVGEILQTPPMHSAVRHEGRHLYELAREGVEVERQPRPAVIHSAELVAFRPGEVAEAELVITSGKGAYMRVLAADLGEALGTGGLLAWLERTAAGPLDLSAAVTLDELRSRDDPGEAVLPPEAIVSFLPRVDLPPPLALRLRHGQPVWLPRLPDGRPRGECRAHDPDGDLVAIGELSGNLLRPLKVMVS